eukprot:TRINITY_DN8518_c0_g2_i3.p1 TRINITY_DN8518_c0_g2~~TRINITY_DN8518_c0_g2_i3.p1  ORF type:complete len:429 (-),score=71.77 TRINITY_DN8518_c0_g2_i3:142-1389(-)
MAVSPPCNVVARQTCETLGAYVVALTYGPASAPHRLAAAVAGSDGVSAVEVLDLPGLRPLRTLSGHTGQVSECSFFNLSSDCLVSCGEDGTCRLWDLRASAAEVQMQTLLSAGGDAITSVSVSPDDAQIACSVAERVAVIDPRSTGEPLWLGDAHSEPVSCVRFRRSRPRELLTGGDDGLVCALDTGTGGARSAARSGGGDEEDDEGLRVVVNVEVAVQKLSFLGEDDGVVAVISTTEALQLWSVHERRPGIRIADYPDLRMDPRLKADESDGYLVDTLFDQRSGRAWVVGGAVDGQMALYHLNFDGTLFWGTLPSSTGTTIGHSGLCGHSAVVRAIAPLGQSEGDGTTRDDGGYCGVPFVTGGEDGLLCLWRADTTDSVESGQGCQSIGADNDNGDGQACQQREVKKRRRRRHV